MEAIKIVLVCIVAAALYGVVHDQFTARICVEYFSVFHPQIFPTTSPTLLGIGWGILATWWVGTILGIFLALASRIGTRPKLRASLLLAPMGKLLLVMAASAVLLGFTGYLLAERTVISPPAWVAQNLAPSRHARFMADWWAHSASYAVGFLGGIALCVTQYRRRIGLNASSANQADRPRVTSKHT